MVLLTNAKVTTNNLAKLLCNPSTPIISEFLINDFERTANASAWIVKVHLISNKLRYDGLKFIIFYTTLIFHGYEI